MDIPALILAIVLGRLASDRQQAMAEATADKPQKSVRKPISIKEIIIDSLQGSALTALLLGLLIGLFAKPEPVYASFYEPVFRGFLSILMLIMGIEQGSRMSV